MQRLETRSSSIYRPGIVSEMAVKNAIYVIILSITMTVDCFLMLKFFSAKKTTNQAILDSTQKKKGYFGAFFDAYIAYVPEFIYTLFCCGYDSFKLMKKRKELGTRGKGKHHEISQTDALLNNRNDDAIEFHYNNDTNQLDPISNIPTTNYSPYHQPQ